MPEIRIKKAKLVERGTKVILSYNETLPDKTHRKVDGMKCDAPPHQDFINALSELRVHWGLLTGFLKRTLAKDKESIEKYVVTGFTLNENGEHEILNITGYMKGEYGSTIANSPRIYLEGGEEGENDEYFLLGNLKASLDNLQKEVLLYLTEGKRGPDQQTAIEFPENGQQEEEPAESEA